MMDQKELEVQRALGTLNTYWIEINFPQRQETIPNLDQFISELIPNSVRFYGSFASTFMLEASPAHLRKLLRALPNKLQFNTASLRSGLHWINVDIFEDQDGERALIKSFKIWPRDEST